MLQSRLTDERIRRSYSVALRANIANVDTTQNLGAHANEIRQVIQKTVEETIPTKRKTEYRWISEVTLKPNKNVSTESTQRYNDLCRRVKKSSREDKEYWVQAQCEQTDKG